MDDGKSMLDIRNQQPGAITSKNIDCRKTRNEKNIVLTADDNNIASNTLVHMDSTKNKETKFDDSPGASCSAMNTSLHTPPVARGVVHDIHPHDTSVITPENDCHRENSHSGEDLKNVSVTQSAHLPFSSVCVDILNNNCNTATSHQNENKVTPIDLSHHKTSVNYHTCTAQRETALSVPTLNKRKFSVTVGDSGHSPDNEVLDFSIKRKIPNYCDTINKDIITQADNNDESVPKTLRSTKISKKKLSKARRKLALKWNGKEKSCVSSSLLFSVSWHHCAKLIMQKKRHLLKENDSGRLRYGTQSRTKSPKVTEINSEYLDSGSESMMDEPTISLDNLKKDMLTEETVHLTEDRTVNHVTNMLANVPHQPLTLMAKTNTCDVLSTAIPENKSFHDFTNSEIFTPNVTTTSTLDTVTDNTGCLLSETTSQINVNMIKYPDSIHLSTDIAVNASENTDVYMSEDQGGNTSTRKNTTCTDLSLSTRAITESSVLKLRTCTNVNLTTDTSVETSTVNMLTGTDVNLPTDTSVETSTVNMVTGADVNLPTDTSVETSSVDMVKGTDVNFPTDASVETSTVNMVTGTDVNLPTDTSVETSSVDMVTGTDVLCLSKDTSVETSAPTTITGTNINLPTDTSLDTSPSNMTTRTGDDNRLNNRTVDISTSISSDTLKMMSLKTAPTNTTSTSLDTTAIISVTEKRNQSTETFSSPMCTSSKCDEKKEVMNMITFLPLDMSACNDKYGVTGTPLHTDMSAGDDKQKGTNIKVVTPPPIDMSAGDEKQEVTNIKLVTPPPIDMSAGDEKQGVTNIKLVTPPPIDMSAGDEKQEVTNIIVFTPPPMDMSAGDEKQEVTNIKLVTPPPIDMSAGDEKQEVTNIKLVTPPPMDMSAGDEKQEVTNIIVFTPPPIDMSPCDVKHEVTHMIADTPQPIDMSTCDVKRKGMNMNAATPTHTDMSTCDEKQKITHTKAVRPVSIDMSACDDNQMLTNQNSSAHVDMSRCENPLVTHRVSNSPITSSVDMSGCAKKQEVSHTVAEIHEPAPVDKSPGEPHRVTDRFPDVTFGIEYNDGVINKHILEDVSSLTTVGMIETPSSPPPEVNTPNVTAKYTTVTDDIYISTIPLTQTNTLLGDTKEGQTKSELDQGTAKDITKG